jgi:AraC-like DNA-binding protein
VRNCVKVRGFCAFREINAAMVIEWSTDSFAPRQRFERWHEACAEHVYALTLQREDRTPFNGRIARRQLGALDVTDIHCDRHVVRRSAQDIAQQPGDDYYVYFQRTGQCWFEQGRTRQVAQAGDMIVADPNIAFVTGTDSFFDLRIWRVDRARLAPLLALTGDGLPMVKLDRHNGDRGLIGSWLDALLRNGQGLSAAGLDTATTTLCTLVANAVGATPEMREHGPLARRRALLQQVMRHVQLHATDTDMDAARLARDFSLSLRTLHQLFEMADTTLHEYLTRERLARARALLRDPASHHLGTMEVGFAAGFSDVSTFYRRFKQAFGVTPGDYRAG